MKKRKMVVGLFASMCLSMLSFGAVYAKDTSKLPESDSLDEVVGLSGYYFGTEGRCTINDFPELLELIEESTPSNATASGSNARRTVEFFMLADNSTPFYCKQLHHYPKQRNRLPR